MTGGLSAGLPALAAAFGLRGALVVALAAVVVAVAVSLWRERGAR